MYPAIPNPNDNDTPLLNQPGADSSDGQAQSFTRIKPKGNYPTGGVVPPELAGLVNVDHILVHQKKEFMEFFNSLEEANQYSVLDGQGALLFHAVERSNFFARNLIGKTRGFTMNFMNPQMQNVVMMKRALRCGLLAMCTQKCCELVTVSLTQGADIGTVEQILPSCCSTRMFFGIKDETGEVRLRIKYPPGMGCCSDMQFELVDMEGNVLGEIRKKWGGFMKEAFTQADNFGITFPIDLDVKLKFLLVSACLLLDFIYFEQN